MSNGHRTKLNLRWSDIDANFHLRHSVFYDLCAQQRMDVLSEFGLTMEVMRANEFGPVLFREECTFRREIGLHDTVFVDLEIRSISADRSRFSFAHTFTKEDGTHCALLIVEGAWMNTRTRKLTAPPEMALNILDRIPRAAAGSSSTV